MYSVCWPNPIKNNHHSVKEQMEKSQQIHTFSAFTLGDDFLIDILRSPPYYPSYKLLELRCRFWDKHGYPPCVSNNRIISLKFELDNTSRQQYKFQLESEWVKGRCHTPHILIKTWVVPQSRNTTNKLVHCTHICSYLQLILTCLGWSANDKHHILSLRPYQTSLIHTHWAPVEALLKIQH